MILPLMSLVTLAFILMATYEGASPLIVSGGVARFVAAHQHGIAFLIASLLGLYFILSYLYLFFNAALVFCVMYRMKGRPCSVSRGLILALKKSGHLFLWTLISSTVLLLINRLEQMNDKIAHFLSLIFGFSWSMSASFVLPIMISENIGPISAFKEAIRLIGQGWRKLLSVNFIFFLILVGILGVGKLIALFYPQFFATLPILPILIGLFLINFIIIQTIHIIYSCGLYLDIKGEEIQGISQSLIHTLVSRPH